MSRPEADQNWPMCVPLPSQWTVTEVDVTGVDLKKRRQRLALTQENLANVLGVAAGTIGGWEEGSIKIPRSVRLRVLLENLQQKHNETLRAGHFREI
jgi:predicted transcriptional regulator